MKSIFLGLIHIAVLLWFFSISADSVFAEGKLDESDPVMVAAEKIQDAIDQDDYAGANRLLAELKTGYTPEEGDTRLSFLEKLLEHADQVYMRYKENPTDSDNRIQYFILLLNHGRTQDAEAILEDLESEEVIQPNIEFLRIILDAGKQSQTKKMQRTLPEMLRKRPVTAIALPDKEIPNRDRGIITEQS